jgi:four helix bundle protein
MADNLIREKSYAFALHIVKFCKQLEAAREYVLARQLLKAGTSIGANVEEALAGQSRADFVAKMSIASKEAREANYWLRLLKDSEMSSPDQLTALLVESSELINILTAIVKTTQGKQ